MEASGLVFIKASVDSSDAQKMLEELNKSLVSLLGHNGTAHVCYNDFRHEKVFFLVGYDAGIPVCCAGVRRMDDTTGEIKRVYARQNRKGIGTALVKELEKYAREIGYRHLVLECRDGNRHAIEFYRRNGYISCAQYPPYTGVSDAVCLEKWLTANPS